MQISFASVLVWTIVSLVVSSSGRPSDANDSGLTGLPTSRGVDEGSGPTGRTIADGKTVADGNTASAIVSRFFLNLINKTKLIVDS